MGRDEGNADDPTGDVLGALIVEQIDAPQSRDIMHPKVDLVKQHSARALSNSLTHNNLFLMPVWKTLGDAHLLVKAKTLPKTLFFSFLTIAALLSLLIPWQFRLKASGSLEPVERAEVFVGADGRVGQLLVDHGSKVQAGDLLVQLYSPELQTQRISINSEIEKANSTLRSLEFQEFNASNSRDPRMQQGSSVLDIKAQRAQAETERKSYAAQLKTLEIQEALLKVASPISGEVVTWDAKRALPQGRPLAAGQRVLTIADTSPESEWELICYLPEKDMGHFLRKHIGEDKTVPTENLLDKNIEVTYVLLNDPSRQLHGRLQEIHRTAELIEEEGVCYRMRVKINMDEDGNRELVHDQPRPGAEVIARIHCGRRPLGFVLFHDAWEWVQTNLLF